MMNVSVENDAGSITAGQNAYSTDDSLPSFSNQDEEMFVDEREQSKTSNDHPSLPIISYIIKEEVQVEEDYDDIVDGEAEQWVS